MVVEFLHKVLKFDLGLSSLCGVTVAAVPVTVPVPVTTGTCRCSGIGIGIGGDNHGWNLRWYVVCAHRWRGGRKSMRILSSRRAGQAVRARRKVGRVRSVHRIVQVVYDRWNMSSGCRRNDCGDGRFRIRSCLNRTGVNPKVTFPRRRHF